MSQPDQYRFFVDPTVTRPPGAAACSHPAAAGRHSAGATPPRGAKPRGGGSSGPGRAGGSGPGAGSGGGGWARAGRGRSRGGPPPQPVALALAADHRDFACLSRYGLFGAVSFEGYLRRTERQLRALCAQGLEVHLRILEPADFEDFCEESGLEPGDPAARVAYAADPDLAGEPFVYAGERLGELLPVLVEDHRARVRISIGCSALLTALERGRRPETRLAAVLQYVARLYLALAAGAGEGCHLLTLRSYGPEDGEQLTAAVEVCVEGGRLFAGGRDAEAFCVTLAAGVAARGSGVMLLHSLTVPGRPPQVRGWGLAQGRPTQLAVPEVLAALADDAALGLGGPAEVEARTGFPLPELPEEVAEGDG
ncbi:hypothetical protein [Kitasatospora sp. NPDC050543]|uniref:hypothetical protein n=1 Tax=Kitasatospora sp. NPDC050543 TaxID=3364054 RepID=UPI0037B3A7A5